MLLGEGAGGEGALPPNAIQVTPEEAEAIGRVGPSRPFQTLPLLLFYFLEWTDFGGGVVGGSGISSTYGYSGLYCL
jgi:hypothetical protein